MKVGLSCYNTSKSDCKAESKYWFKIYFLELHLVYLIRENTMVLAEGLHSEYTHLRMSLSYEYHSHLIASIELFGFIYVNVTIILIV